MVEAIVPSVAAAELAQFLGSDPFNALTDFETSFSASEALPSPHLRSQLDFGQFDGLLRVGVTKRT